MDKKLLKQYLNRTGFQDGTTMDLKYINPGFDKSEGMASGMGGFPIVPAAGIGAVLALNKKRGIGDNNPPSPIKEDKTPQQEPPEDKEPDIISELATGEILKESEDKIKNKITTWEKYMSRDEAEKAVKEINITLKDLEIPGLKKQITFRKTGDGFVILFDRKVVGELVDITQSKQEANDQIGNTRSYQMSIINEDGSKGDAYDIFDGEKNAKDFAKDDIAKALLRETKDPNYPTLRDIFQNLEYNKKGEPKAIAEEYKRFQKEIEDSRSKKAYGGLMDKPLTGRSRDI